LATIVTEEEISGQFIPTPKGRQPSALYAIKMFALLPENMKRVKDYFFENMQTILEENLEGQCRTGHSCQKQG
jgi:hypothetical protein